MKNLDKATHHDVFEDEDLDRLIGELRTMPAPAVSPSVATELERRIQEKKVSLLKPPARSPLATVFGFAIAAGILGLLIQVAATGGPRVALHSSDHRHSSDHLHSSDQAGDNQSDKQGGPAKATVDLTRLPKLEHETESLPVFDARALAQDAVIASSVVPIQFALPGVATWTMAPDSRVSARRIRGDGRGQVVLRLDKGMVAFEVTPQSSASEMVEAVVVECRGTRVAVHGTVFSVKLVGDEVVVDVTRGSVSVGPKGRGSSTGRILVGPHRSAFDARRASWLRNLGHDQVVAHGPTAGPTPRLAPPAGPDAANDGIATRPKANALADVTAAERYRMGLSTRAPKRRPQAGAATTSPAGDQSDPPPLTVASLRAQLGACIGSKMALSAGAKNVTLRTRVTLRAANGQVEAVAFNPPLRPEVQQACAARYFGVTLDRDMAVDIVFKK